MFLFQWISNLFCRHSRQIVRRRDSRMGLECLSCFRWRPLDAPEHGPDVH
jgi:hypothetical protein